MSLLFSVLSAVAVGAAFKQISKRISDEDAPKALESEYGWREVLVAAALQGVVFALGKAAIQRDGAKGFERMTGVWPGLRANDRRLAGRLTRANRTTRRAPAPSTSIFTGVRARCPMRFRSRVGHEADVGVLVDPGELGRVRDERPLGGGLGLLATPPARQRIRHAAFGQQKTLDDFDSVGPAG